MVHTARTGAPKGNRTLDLLLTMETLCRLSYRGSTENFTQPLATTEISQRWYAAHYVPHLKYHLIKRRICSNFPSKQAVSSLLFYTHDDAAPPYRGQRPTGRQPGRGPSPAMAGGGSVVVVRIIR